MKKGIWLSLLTFLLVGTMGFSVLAAVTPQYEADFTITDGKGKVTSSGKTYVDGLKIRQETVVDGQTSITILRLDKKVTWTLMPENQYMEIKLPFDPAYPTEDVQFDQTVIGNETINGYDCQIIQYTYKEKKYGVMVQWVPEKLGFAVRIQTKNSKGKVTSTIDYTNIKPGKQPSSLFEIPEGYQKFNPFGGLKLPGQ